MNIKIALLTAACALALSACGDGSAPPADSPATAPADTAVTPVETAPAPAPAPVETTDAAAEQAPGAADGSDPVASGCEIEIESNDAMQFNTRSISVPASCTDFTITMQHVGNMPVAAMGHNVVVTAASDMAAVAADGIAAGAAAGYIKAGDERVIAQTDLIGGGESASVTFAVSKIKDGGPYEFFCSFPGHAALMKGTISVQ